MTWMEEIEDTAEQGSLEQWQRARSGQPCRRPPAPSRALDAGLDQSVDCRRERTKRKKGPASSEQRAARAASNLISSDIRIKSVGAVLAGGGSQWEADQKEQG